MVETKAAEWPEMLTGPDDPRILPIPDCIDRLRWKCQHDGADALEVSRRVLRELLRGYDNAAKFKDQVADTCKRAEAAEAQLGAGLTTNEALELNETHKRLLRRGRAGRWIGLSDDAGTRTAELVALGQMERGGLVEATKESLPPGPPTLPPRVLTASGLTALANLEE